MATTAPVSSGRAERTVTPPRFSYIGIMSNMIDPLVERIASRIRAERERRRWTLAQLAEASGVSRAMINRIERGESNPTAVVLGKLSAAFRISVASLLGETEETAVAETPAG